MNSKLSRTTQWWGIKNPFSIVVIAAIIFTIVISNVLISPRSAKAATALNTFSHARTGSSSSGKTSLANSSYQDVLIDSFSHYMKESSLSSLDNDAAAMGTQDVAKENSQINCTGSNNAAVTATLDFGQAWGSSTARDWGGLVMQYSDAGQAMYYYINSWKTSAKSCLSLTAVLGINNSYICGSIYPVTPCDGNNGAALEQEAASVDATYSYEGILVVGGSDIEIDPTYWSNYSATQKWLAGYFGAGQGFFKVAIILNACNAQVLYFRCIKLSKKSKNDLYRM